MDFGLKQQYVFIFEARYWFNMTTATLEQVYEDIQSIKFQLKRLTMMVEEDFELSDDAKKDLAEARKTSRAEYIRQKDMEKKFLI